MRVGMLEEEEDERVDAQLILYCCRDLVPEVRQSGVAMVDDPCDLDSNGAHEARQGLSLEVHKHHPSPVLSCLLGQVGILDPKNEGVQNTAYCLFLAVLLRGTCSRLDDLGGVDCHNGWYGMEARHQRRFLHEDGSMDEVGRGRAFGMGSGMEHRLEDGKDVEDEPLTAIRAYYTRCCRGAPVGTAVGGGGIRCDGLEMRGSLTGCAIGDP